ncbi:substrate-binding domain-containing protein [Actinomadura parmotrematis]|uniref:Substrate-binding domain-containing protein n=1 Tax=Actinomadura parmotrematis TaxID=2864039 RepID=A0ABS7FWN0_9ACTN|nr:substrate-binding domain-containing protein [Actinomadura parmotrematis]MBW8484832.1 substrate-binding domain-containing protein [Actinomadura parmotrematis]
MGAGIRSGKAGIGAAAVATALLAGACGSPGTAADGGKDAPVKVGLVYSKSGPLAAYGKQYIEGFRAGLDVATNGTGKVGSRKVEVTEVDDAGDPAKAVSGAKDLIGKGYKVIAGSTASGVATQVSAIAEQNKVLFVSGPAATDALTGAGKFTFRSGRQTWQDIATAATFAGDVKGRKVVVFAQDGAFGQANLAAVKTVLGGKGATVEPLMVPASATDLTPFATKAKAAKPDMLFVAWAGATAQAMWGALGQQGVFDVTKVVTGLDTSATWPAYGKVAGKVTFLNHYFGGAAGTALEKQMTERVTKAGSKPEIFTPDGFTAAQMIVHAAAAGGDAAAMAKALEGWSFDGVKGRLTVRAGDHALLQPMYQAKLSEGAAPAASVVKTLPADQVAPPAAGK